MKIEKLKSDIENGSIDDSPIIFIFKDSPFICYQYVNKISKVTNKTINYLDDISEISNSSADIFSMQDAYSDEIKFYCSDSIDFIPPGFRNNKYSYIVASKVDVKVKKEYDDLIITVPKIEDWQIRDYAYSTTSGLDNKSIDWIIDICKKDLFRIDNELDKLRLFDKEERQNFFSQMASQGIFSDLSPYEVFDLTNAISKKDLLAISKVLSYIDNYDAEPLGVVAILLNQFKKLITVLLHPNPTEASTGLKNNVIYAIKKSGTRYNKNQLIKSFEFLCDIDRRLKIGEIDTKWLIDWVICNILTF